MADQQSYDGFISYSHAADDLLAPRLQAGLQRFAKPWWKRRAVRIFRDESSLAANPHLWSSITEALESSGWFVLLLSPDAASSEWVGKEIEHWKATKPADRILPVVTDGEFGWSDGDVAGSSVPQALRGVFTEEPRWVDLRFARNEEHLDLQNPTFSAAIADIASAIRGVPKDELESEEVRQHRKTVRTAWAAGALVAVLAVASVGFGVQSSRNAGEAERQARIASQNAAAEAEARELADANAAEANRQRVAAEQAEALAQARELAASAINLLDDDPELSILLAIASAASAGGANPPIESRVALREALYASTLLRRFELPGGERTRHGALSPDGTRFAWLSADSITVRMYDTATFKELWAFSEPSSVDNADVIHFSADGSLVGFNSVDSSVQTFSGTDRPDTPDEFNAMIRFLDSESGQLVRILEFDTPCNGAQLGPQSPDGAFWAVITGDDAPCDVAQEWTLRMIDSVSFEEVGAFPAGSPSDFSWSLDSLRISISSHFGLGTRVYEVRTGELLLDVPGLFGSLSPDGATLAVGRFDGNRVVYLFDVDSGMLVERLAGLSDTAFAIEFTPEGSSLIAGDRGGRIVVWDLSSGNQALAIPDAGETIEVLYDPGRERLIHVSETSLTVWDLSGRAAGESNTHLLGGPVQGNSMVSNGSSGAMIMFPDRANPVVLTFDARTGDPTGASIDVDMGRPPAIVEDGRMVVRPRRGIYADDTVEFGPVSIWNPSTGESTELVGCWARASDLRPVADGVSAGKCSDRDREWFDSDRFLVDQTGTTLLVTSTSGELLFFDANTMTQTHTLEVSGLGGALEFGGDWLAISSNPTGVVSSSTEVTFLALPSGEPVTTVPGTLTAASPDGSRMAVHDRPGGFTIYDTETWASVVSTSAGEGRMRGLEFSPDGSFMMSAGTDGFVRIWDATSGTELDRIPIEGASDGHWLDDEHLVLGTADGLWTTVSLKITEVVELAADRVTRGLTAEECTTYRLDPCPTLEELRGG